MNKIEICHRREMKKSFLYDKMKIKLNFLFSTERPHFSQGLNKVSFTPQGSIFINCIILLRTLLSLLLFWLPART